MGRTKCVVIIGLGRLGLTNALWYCSKGFEVIAFDKNKKKINFLKRGILEETDKRIKQLFDMYYQKIVFLSTPETLPKRPSIVAICVDNTYDSEGKNDMTSFNGALDIIKDHIVLKTPIAIYSLVPPRTNREVVSRLSKQTRHNVKVISIPIFISNNNLYDAIFNPKAMIIGVNDDESHLFMSMVYFSFITRDITIVYTDPVTAEISVYVKTMYEHVHRNVINEINEIINNENASQSHLQYFFNDNLNLLNLSTSNFYDTSLEEYGCFEEMIEKGYCYPIIKVNYEEQRKEINLLIESLNNFASVGIIGVKENPYSFSNVSIIHLVKELLKSNNKIYIYDQKLLPFIKKELGALKKLYYCYDIDTVISSCDAIVIDDNKSFDEIKEQCLNKKKDILIFKY